MHHEQKTLRLFVLNEIFVFREEMEVEIQKQDFRSIEDMETTLRLQKSEVCFITILS